MNYSTVGFSSCNVGHMADIFPFTLFHKAGTILKSETAVLYLTKLLFM